MPTIERIGQTAPKKMKERMSDGQLRAAIKSAAGSLMRDPSRLKPLILTGIMGAGKAPWDDDWQRP